MKRGRNWYAVVAVFAFSLCSFGLVSADRLSSTSYVIDANTTNGLGGSSSSTSYKLVSSGGETVIGNGSAGSYKLGMGYAAQLENNLSLTIQPSGLVASYPLNETTGSMLAEQSVYGVYGTMHGTLSSVSGKLGTALGFNGSNQAVLINSGVQTRLSSAGTVEAWVKTSSSSGDMAVVAKDDNFWLGVSSGRPAMYDWTSSTMCYDTATISDGAWHHVAMTLSSGVSNGSVIYVDGVAKKTCTWTPHSQAGSVAIGADSSNGSTFTQYFNGSIDHVKVLNRALAADEVQAEYTAQNVATETGLSLGTITPGASNTVLSDVIVQTDAGGYALAVNQDHNLLSGSDSIPAVSGSIASPAVWSEGTTKGLGFTLTATNATAIPGSWNSGNSYAAFPSTATTFYSRIGMPSSIDYLTMRIRADVASTQASNTTSYTNTITVTGTITP